MFLPCFIGHINHTMDHLAEVGKSLRERWNKDFTWAASSITMENGEIKMKYVCNVCGWVYDEAEGLPEQNVAPGTKFEDLPEDFACPLCGVGKDDFSAE